MNKNALKTYAVWARVQLMEQVKQKAFEYGITEDSFGDENVQTIGTRALSNAEVTQRAELVNQIKSKGFNQVIEEVAYTWFNRFIALRYMEVNNYLPSRVRVFTNENNEFEPEILKEAISIELDGLDKNIVFDLVDKQDNDALYKYLLITQCNALNPLLPGMFEKISNYTELLFPNNLLRPDSVIGKMVSDIPEEDWTDQVQIIGWMYQYYNIEPKAKVFARANGTKIKKEEVPAATQLFTPDWIVRYMVENSLGRLWYEGHKSFDKSQWKYYLDEAEQEESVKAQLDKIKAEYANIKVEEIKIIDPCMGSGHILVYAFDVLMQIYLSQGYSERDAAQSILENNLYGLDIDDRAYQLAYFSVMMKARSYDRKILTRGIKPNVYSIQESNFLKESWYKISKDAKFKDIFKEIVNTFIDAKEYGSILDVPAKDYDYALSVIDDFEQNGTIDFDTKKYLDNIDVIRNLIGQAKALSQKYDVVATNPPYMGSSGMSGKLSDFVKKYYPESKSDLFAVFIEKGNSMIRHNGYNSMVTMQSWMFLSSFQAMREHLIQSKDIVTLMYMENMVMGIAFGTAVTVFRNSYVKYYKGTYNQIKLCDIENNRPKSFPIKENRFNQVSTSNFSKIPGSPIAYWASEQILCAYNEGKLLSTIAEPKQGLKTGDNDTFLRLWHEINCLKFSIICGEEAKWFPCNKGGDYRRWYGNNNFVIDWENDGHKLKNFRHPDGRLKSRPQNLQFMKKAGLTYTNISSGNLGIRYSPEGFLFDAAGSMIFTSKERLLFLLAFMGSKVATLFTSITSPTMTFEVGQLSNIPVKLDLNSAIDEMSKYCIDLEKQDWDSFETSWDFKKHPLVSGQWLVVSGQNTNHSSLITNHYAHWEKECAERFNQLKANEEELNRIFIDIYGLQDELTPEVEDKDVTVRKADLVRDIKSLISYAVGCMFGRYSLDVDGLAYAGGEFDSSKYSTYIPDQDNILPICDDEYFDDDIVGKFVKFIKVVYGAETLEENLRFIADALGGKGTPREVIRNYFINDFYKDHCKTYQKRPIYWMFDSGKKNGFKALVYMHRYRGDTIARMRTDYVHEQQERYRTLSESLSIEYDNATGTDRTKIGKQIDKLKDQLIEIGDFEEKVHHLADQMIDIDLDDGVKVNYAKFGDILAKIK